MLSSSPSNARSLRWFRVQTRFHPQSLWVKASLESRLYGREEAVIVMLLESSTDTCYKMYLVLNDALAKTNIIQSRPLLMSECECLHSEYCLAIEGMAWIVSALMIKLERCLFRQMHHENQKKTGLLGRDQLLFRSEVLFSNSQNISDKATRADSEVTPV